MHVGIECRITLDADSDKVDDVDSAFVGSPLHQPDTYFVVEFACAAAYPALRVVVAHRGLDNEPRPQVGMEYIDAPPDGDALMHFGILRGFQNACY
jgi:hypothetical protein